MSTTAAPRRTHGDTAAYLEGAHDRRALPDTPPPAGLPDAYYRGWAAAPVNDFRTGWRAWWSATGEEPPPAGQSDAYYRGWNAARWADEVELPGIDPAQATAWLQGLEAARDGRGVPHAAGCGGWAFGKAMKQSMPAEEFYHWCTLFSVELLALAAGYPFPAALVRELTHAAP